MTAAFVIVLLAFYFAPSLVAVLRSHRQTAPIIVLNLFLGWTLIGWVIALVWSVAATPKTVVIREIGQ